MLTTATLHDFTIYGVAALVVAGIPICIGYWPALICLFLSMVLVGFACLNSYAINRAASQVSGFAKPDARYSSSLDASLLHSVSPSPSLSPPEYEADDKIDNEPFKTTTLRRSVTAVTARIKKAKPRRGRSPSVDSTAPLHHDISGSLPPKYEAPSHDPLSDSKPSTKTPVMSRKRALTLPAPPSDAQSLSGFSFPPREPAPTPTPMSVPAPPEKPSPPKLIVRIPTTTRSSAPKSPCKPSPSPVSGMTSALAPFTSAKSRPFRRYLQSLRRIPGRLKGEEGMTLQTFDSLSFGPLQRSISVKGARTARHDTCAESMTRCATVAA